MHNKHFFLLVSIVIALLFWIFDSYIHYYIYDEPQFELILSDFNELWMRAIIVCLFVAFGYFADIHTNKIMNLEKEKHDIYMSMLIASQNILSNFLQKAFYFKNAAKNSKNFDPVTIDMYDKTIKETEEKLNKLKNISELSKVNIEKRLLCI